MFNSEFQASNSELRTPNSPLRTSRGVALIMVLWVIAILSVIAMEFAFAMRTEVTITRHYRGGVQLYGYAEGGIHRAIAELIYKHDPAIQQMRKADKVVEVSENKEWLTDGRPYLLTYDQGTCEIRVMGESGKINLNFVSDNTLRKIIGQMGLEGEARDVVVDSILDWRDPDDFYRVNGAESEYYQSLKEPYTAKNGNFDSIEELLLVRGVTPDLFYGKKGTKQEETGDGEGGETGKVGLRDLFTLYSSGEQIDINSAALPVLRVVLGLPSEVARSIVKAREEKGFSDPQDLTLRVPEMGPFIGEAGKLIVYQSSAPYYTIESRGKAKEGTSVQGIKAVVRIDSTERTGYKFVQWVDRLL